MTAGPTKKQCHKHLRNLIVIRLCILAVKGKWSPKTVTVKDKFTVCCKPLLESPPFREATHILRSF